MTILKDILDVVRDFNGSSEDFKEALSTRRYSSISKRSLEGTLQFPVIVSKALDIDTAQMISKALERQFATFVQIVVTMNPELNMAKDKNIANYLRKFHQNTGIKTDLKDVAYTASQLLEAYDILCNEEGVALHFFTVCEGATNRVIIDNREQLVDLLEHLNTDTLNDKFIPTNVLKVHLPDENVSAYHNNMIGLGESVTSRDLRQAKNTIRSAGLLTGDAKTDGQQIMQLAKTNADSASGRQSGRMGVDAQQRARDNAKLQLDINKDQREQQKLAKDLRYEYTLPNNILKDNDARKANELVPTTMHLRTLLFDGENQEQGTAEFVVGIKATLHPVATKEMVDNVVNACKNSSKVFNFIRWTTGEISFFKDFLFGIGEIKDDVFNRSSGSSAWWITLKRRRSLAKIKNRLLMPGQLLPNATIVLSMDEVEHIKAINGYDLLDASTVYKIMEKYFLLSFVVVDNASQIAHFMFDGQSSYQTVTFGALEKENTNKADMREVMKLINRSNMV